MTPETTVQDVNGVRLYTRTLGEGPDVVVLHGGPGAHHDYLLPQVDRLAERRRLRYYDQRGGGQSPVGRETPVGWREQVADLDALLTAWRISGASILGYSWGGLLALLYAVSHPTRIQRLALVSPAAITTAGRAAGERRFAERARDPEIVGERRRLGESGLRERDPDTYRKRMFELSVAPYFHDVARVRDLTPFRVTGRTQDAVWQSLGDYDLRRDVAALSVQAIVLHGRYDPISLGSAEETARLLGARLVTFEESGHVPYVEETDRFVTVLDGFLPPNP